MPETLVSYLRIIMHYMPLWLLAVNFITFFVYRLDKRRAVRRQWRIPERTLLLLALIGGSIGAFAGMLIHEAGGNGIVLPIQDHNNLLKCA